MYILAIFKNGKGITARMGTNVQEHKWANMSKLPVNPYYMNYALIKAKYVSYSMIV